ncbi:MAG: adenylate/guanylate cyclase domain-containing protein [Deltaproteobacteria bacterium]|uniref:Adenylate/guanylate cyclase domain-containing protein n=1 Tax=Candidatus Desulfacyla euxinica TaxID=2841693 RepID=A0A8J6MXS3_9DELT|nr:adenylate/guanylate cyclase domain-containing protein [Candidatus Desulfacyla euxinica]
MTTKDVKRKLTAILSADVQGYSRLMGDDEVATVETITAYRKVMTDLIQDHHGRVVDAKGDNVLAEFPSVVDAIQCSVEIQKELGVRNADLPEHRRMEFRIGINLGDVIEKEGTIYGDGVNVAARLEGLAEGGGICVSGTVYDQIENKLPMRYENLGEHRVKNITKPVRVYRVGMEPGERRFPERREMGAASEAPELSDNPSIAVLPFDNLSGDPEQVYFVDGIVDDIITELSRFPYIFVIARTTSFTFKGKSVDVRQVGRELGVRYVLEGSVRKISDRVRITAQLIEAATGNHIWAERYDRNLEDIFSVQDEITAQVVGSIHPELYSAEMRRARQKPVESLDVWNYAVRARWHVLRLTREDNSEAKRLFGKALELEPDYVPALAFLVYCHICDVLFGWSQAPPESITEARRLARKAASLDENDPWVQCALGFTEFISKNPDAAIAYYRKAIELNPNFALAHGYLSCQLAYAGEAEAAIEAGRKAIRLSSCDPELFHFHVGIGTGHFVAGRYAEAVTWANKVIAERPETPAGRRLLAASLAQLGQIAEARRALEDVLSITPGLTATLLRNITHFKRPADFDRYIDALRRAGLPD